MNERELKCRVCGGSKPESGFREMRDGSYVTLAYCRDCKRRDDVTHNRGQRLRVPRRITWS